MNWASNTNIILENQAPLPMYEKKLEWDLELFNTIHIDCVRHVLRQLEVSTDLLSPLQNLYPTTGFSYFGDSNYSSVVSSDDIQFGNFFSVE